MARAPNVNQLFAEQFSFRAPVTPQRLAMPPQETLQAAPVSWRDRLKDALGSVIGRHNAEMALQVADFTPLGVAFAGNEARLAADRGGYGEAAAGAAMAALPIPAARGAGKVAREVAQEVPTISTRALPMDKASRMARATKQGFTVDAYHGTTSNFDQFERIDGGNQYGEGFYFAPTPESASRYASGDVNRITPQGNAGPNVMPVKLALNKPFNRREMLDRATINKIERAVNEANPGYFKRGELASNFDRAYPPNGDNVLQATGMNPDEANAVLQQIGFDGINDGQMYVVFDPANIRSRFAAFDPAKRNSKNLMAGVAGAGVTGAATITTQSQRKDGGGI